MRKLAAIIAIIEILSAVSAFAADNVVVGACIYRFEDTYMTDFRNAMREEMNKQGGELEIADSQNSQTLQNDQVDTYITKGVNALIINPVDRESAGLLIQKAKAAGLPIVLVNREPYPDVMSDYDKVWYVGARAEDSGIQSGQIIADYFKANPKADKNGDGKMQYVMIRGEEGHQDATLWVEYVLKTINDAGVEAVELCDDVASWDKAIAADKMKGFISEAGIDNIEVVLANNDDMALGAIEALKAEGYNMGDAGKYIPVIGVDANASALEAMRKGEMLGTVFNDAENQGSAAVRIAVTAACGKPVTEESIGYAITGGKYILLPYMPVTLDNYREFIK